LNYSLCQEHAGTDQLFEAIPAGWWLGKKIVLLPEK
jgi:myo-inositol catabolism protein IolC